MGDTCEKYAEDLGAGLRLVSCAVSKNLSSLENPCWLMTIRVLSLITYNNPLLEIPVLLCRFKFLSVKSWLHRLSATCFSRCAKSAWECSFLCGLPEISSGSQFFERPEAPRFPVLGRRFCNTPIVQRTHDNVHWLLLVVPLGVRTKLF